MELKRPPEDPRSTDELVAVSLEGDPESKPAWDAVVALQWRGTREVLVAARALCGSSDPRRRSRGADILGQLGIPERAFPNESLQLLLSMLRPDEDPFVLNAATTALGHLGDARAVAAVSVLRHHASDEVRFGVVFGLIGHDDPVAIESLIELTEDADPEIRDWATFGIGSQIDVDTVAIREALARRLEDSDPNVVREEMVGLARRKDRRALPLVIKALRSGVPEDMDLEAAAKLGDPSLLPLLNALEPDMKEQPGFRCALEACRRRPTDPGSSGIRRKK